MAQKIYVGAGPPDLNGNHNGRGRSPTRRGGPRDPNNGAYGGRSSFKVVESILREDSATRPYTDAHNCSPIAWWCITVTFAQIAVFMWYDWRQKPSERVHLDNFCASCEGTVGPLMFAPALKKQVWRFLSYCLAHNGMAHLVTSITIQIVVGLQLEMVHKYYRIVPLYLLAIVLGACMQYIVDPGSFLVGASPAGYALITANISNIVVNWNEIPQKFFRIAIIVIWVLVDGYLEITTRFNSDKCSQASFSANLGGIITGLLFGTFIMRNLVEHRWERVLRAVCLCIYFLVFCVAMSITFYKKPKSNPDWAAVDCRANDTYNFYTDDDNDPTTPAKMMARF